MSTSSASHLSTLLAALAAGIVSVSSASAADDVPAPADGTNLTQAVQNERRADCTGSIEDAARGMTDTSASPEAQRAAEASLQAARLAQQAGEQTVCAALVQATRDLLGQERAPEQASGGDQ